MKNLLFADFDVHSYEPLYRKSLLLHIILLASMIGFGLFFLINFFLLSNSFISFLNFLAFVIEVYAFYSIRKTGSLDIATSIVVFNLFIFLLLLVFIQEGKDFTFIWTIFFPITAIFLMGSRKGIVYSFAFYTIFFTMAYLGIGVWQNGEWNSVSFIRLVFASLILIYVLFLVEQSSEKSYIALKSVREKEKKYLEQLHQSSITDHLTGLYNRRELDNLFEKAFKKAQKEKKYFAFFISDIDFFKEYNDTYGHHKGDIALQEISNVFKQHLHKGLANIFRLGGEEFGGFVIDKDKDAILSYLDTIRKDIETLNIAHTKSTSSKLTASFGVCILSEYSLDDFEIIYKLADKLLYEAKESGRNITKGELAKI